MTRLTEWTLHEFLIVPEMTIQILKKERVYEYYNHQFFSWGLHRQYCLLFFYLDAHIFGGQVAHISKSVISMRITIKHWHRNSKLRIEKFIPIFCSYLWSIQIIVTIELVIILHFKVMLLCILLLIPTALNGEGMLSILLLVNTALKVIDKHYKYHHNRTFW